MHIFQPCVIKSFKHDGHLHRMWMENWKVPKEAMHKLHLDESMIVSVNYDTRIREADGSEWVSKVPGVSFFIPGTWYNIVALIESQGVRYYCNLASPPYDREEGVITYIDYDLDVIVFPDGHSQLVDQDEFEKHKRLYRYDRLVQDKIKHGLADLKNRIHQSRAPFDDDVVQSYFDAWFTSKGR